jgi:hypothetical protein
MIRTRAQLVNHRFLTRETRFGPQVFHMGLVVDKVTVGQVCFELFCIPMSVSLQQMLRTHRFIHIILEIDSVATYNTALSPSVPSEGVSYRERT